MLTNTIYTITRQDGNGCCIVACTYEKTTLRDILLDTILEEVREGFDSPVNESWTNRLEKRELNNTEKSLVDLDNLDDLTITFAEDEVILTVNTNTISDNKKASRKWHFGFQQEFPESRWGNIMGIIEDNTGLALFYAVGTDDNGNWNKCKIFSSIDLNEDSFLVCYPWNDKNDSLLIKTLNKAAEKDEDMDFETLLRSIPFEQE